MSWKSKTYDVQLPALAIRGPELRQSLRVWTVASLYLAAHGALLSGAHINNFCRMIGFDDFDMGLLTSLPPLAVFAQVLATLPIERTGLRKHQFIQCSLWARMGWVAIAGVGLLVSFTSPSRYAAWAVLGVFVVMGCLDSFAGPAGATWTADILPRRIRARYVAFRDTWSRAIALIIPIGVGLLMGHVTVTGPNDTPIIKAAAQPLLLRTICGIFLMAATLGLAMLLFHRIREILPPVAAAKHQSFSEVIVDTFAMPLRDRTFRLFTICTMVLGFGQSVGGIYLWQNCGPANLGFNDLASNVTFIVGGTLTSMLTLRPLGRLVDRFGRKPVIVVCAFATTFGILPWAFITKGMTDFGLTQGLNYLSQAAGSLVGRPEYHILPQGLPVGAFLAGLATASFASIAWTGVGLAQQSFIFGFSDLEGRSKYIAAFSVITTVGVIFGGIIGGLVTKNLEFLQKTPLVIGPVVWNNWHISFVLGGLARVAGAIMLMRLPDEGSRTPGDLLNHMAGWLPRLVTRVFPFGGR